MNAVVETGGKQYTVKVGDKLDVELLHAEPGEMVEIDRVLMVKGDDEIVFGNPTVPGARVMAQVLEHFKGKKIIVFKFKAKTRYRRKNGHRQNYTRLAIRQIVGPEAVE